MEYLDPNPKVPKYQTMGHMVSSLLGVVLIVLGMYSVFGYLDPQGNSCSVGKLVAV